MRVSSVTLAGCPIGYHRGRLMNVVPMLHDTSGYIRKTAYQLIEELPEPRLPILFYGALQPNAVYQVNKLHTYGVHVIAPDIYDTDGALWCTLVTNRVQVYDPRRLKEVFVYGPNIRHLMDHYNLVQHKWVIGDHVTEVHERYSLNNDSPGSTAWRVEPVIDSDLVVDLRGLFPGSNS